MGEYGQFNVVTFDDAQKLCDLFSKMSIGDITIHRAGTTVKMGYADSLSAFFE